MSLVNAGPRSLGAFTVGPVSYGLWRYTNDDLAAAQSLIEAALDAGMNLIDTSDVYGFDWGGDRLRRPPRSCSVRVLAAGARSPGADHPRHQGRDHPTGAL